MSDSNFACDACRKKIPDGSMAWALKDHSHIFCSDVAFCLCDDCHVGALSNTDTILKESSEFDYKAWAYKISGCCMHNSDQTKNRGPCRCLCPRCGQYPAGASETWRLGSSDAYGVTFTFLMCPACVVAKLESNNFSEEWFDRHLEQRQLDASQVRCAYLMRSMFG